MTTSPAHRMEDVASDTSLSTVEEKPRSEYANKLELMLSLVGYAVGLGNIWRFPYLAYTYGGGAFLIPYFCCLALLGLPLFILEMGLGQLTRRGTLGLWQELKLPRLQGVGIAATICTFLVSLYYNVILAWAIYYLGRTFAAVPSGVLPWSDAVDGFECPETVIYPTAEIANSPYLIDGSTGLYNSSFAGQFWCAADAGEATPAGYVAKTIKATSCPARAASVFWQAEALQQSSGLEDLGGFNLGMLISFTVAWLLIYFVIFNGVASSGKVVYVTATLPYLCLLVFFVRAITLPGASIGVEFFVTPDFAKVADPEVWLKAAVQIFYSLGPGFGSLIAFASFGSKSNNFAKDATKVSFINCGTSIFAGFVVFPLLGYLAHELSEVDPCISGKSLDELSSIGLSGTGLAFVAFPIAISKMPGGFVWAVLFFVMLLCLGIDSQFAMVESVVTVLSDAGLEKRLSRQALSGSICFISYLIGLIFVTKAGVYWVNLFDNYSSLLVLFAVTGCECVGLMWSCGGQTWKDFKFKCKEWTGIELGPAFSLSWKWLCPLLLAVLLLANITPPLGKLDLMGAESSVAYPEGKGYLPSWSMYIGWCLAVLPLFAVPIFAAFSSLPKTEVSVDGKEGMPKTEVSVDC
eukprot:TRINITY_DN90148_c0_g1_i1.p1 TRINITY_DN90148_c0_g1~~TRINITY_DN90148_c0_g1_i1.p1  ORF type:complete len:653 (+),score=95.98 TRINITY_DN90148_c0_g1_i1:56-1960(+)